MPDPLTTTLVAIAAVLTALAAPAVLIGLLLGAAGLVEVIAFYGRGQV